MRLNIVEQQSGFSAVDGARLYHQMQRRWSEHLCDPVGADAGTVFVSADLPDVTDGNRLLDAVVPPGRSPADTLRDVESLFSSSRCRAICLNPHVDLAQHQPLIDHLQSLGWTDAGYDIYRAGAIPAEPAPPADLRIIPARASYRHTEAFFATIGNVDAMMRHLDDPHYDLLLALHDNQAIGTIGVLSGGDVGLIEQFYLSPSADRAAGDLLMTRLLQTCVRATFRHVLTGPLSPPDRMKAWGFSPTGRFTCYAPPGS